MKSLSNTPGSTVAVMVFSSISKMRFMRSSESTTPPWMGTAPPHSPVPAPRGVTAMFFWAQYPSTLATPSALSHSASASGAKAPYSVISSCA